MKSVKSEANEGQGQISEATCEVGQVKSEVSEVSGAAGKQKEKSFTHSCGFDPKQAYQIINIDGITPQKNTQRQMIRKQVWRVMSEVIEAHSEVNDILCEVSEVTR